VEKRDQEVGEEKKKIKKEFLRWKVTLQI